MGPAHVARSTPPKHDISHHATSGFMGQKGSAASSKARTRKRIGVLHERRYSNALWHAGWHVMRDPLFSGMHLMAFMDDSSRCVTGAQLFEGATSENAILALHDAILVFGKPAVVLSSSSSSLTGSQGPTEFESELTDRGIGLGTSDMRQLFKTGGKLKRFFRSLEKEISYHDGMSEYVDYYNEYRLHFSLDIDSYETPLKAFMARKATPAIRKRNPKWADEDIGGDAT